MENYFLTPQNNYQKFLFKKNIDFSLRFIFDLMIHSNVFSDSLEKEDIAHFHSQIKFLNDLSAQFNDLSTYNILNGLFEFSNKQIIHEKITNQLYKSNIKNDMLYCYLNYFQENKNNSHFTSMDRSFSYVLSYISKVETIDYNVVRTLMKHTDWTRYEMIEFLNHLTVLTPSTSLELLKEFSQIESFKTLPEEDLTRFIKGFIKYSLDLEIPSKEHDNSNYCDFVIHFEQNQQVLATHRLAHLGLILPKKIIQSIIEDFNFNASLFVPELNFEKQMVDVKFGIDKFISYCKYHQDKIDNKTLHSLFFPNGIEKIFDDAIMNIKDKQHQKNPLKILSKVVNFIKIHNNLAAALNLQPFHLQLDSNLKAIVKSDGDAISLLEKFKLEQSINSHHQQTKKLKI